MNNRLYLFPLPLCAFLIELKKKKKGCHGDIGDRNLPRARKKNMADLCAMTIFGFPQTQKKMN